MTGQAVVLKVEPMTVQREGRMQTAYIRGETAIQESFCDGIWWSSGSITRLEMAMARDETRPAVAASDVFGDLLIAPLPDGTKAEAVFVLVKLDDGEWCARGVGGDAFNRVEFLGQLTAYTHSLIQSEAEGWFDDGDPST